MKLAKVALAIAGLMSLSLVSARADTVYDWTFSGTDVSGSGTFTVGGLVDSSVGPSDGYYLVGATGTINGVNITGTTSYFGSDNVIYLPPDQPGGYSITDNFGIALALSNGDIEFTGASAPSTYIIDASSSSSVISSSCGVGGCSYVDSFTLTLNPVTTTPLPATWTLMLIGLAGLGFLLYRRQGENTKLAAA